MKRRFFQLEFGLINLGLVGEKEPVFNQKGVYFEGAVQFWVLFAQETFLPGEGVLQRGLETPGLGREVGQPGIFGLLLRGVIFSSKKEKEKQKKEEGEQLLQFETNRNSHCFFSEI